MGYRESAKSKAKSFYQFSWLSVFLNKSKGRTFFKKMTCDPLICINELMCVAFDSKSKATMCGLPDRQESRPFLFILSLVA